MKTIHFSKAMPAAVALLLTVATLSCKKEKTDPQPEPCVTNVASLSGTYKLTALKYKQTATAAEQDFLALKDACEKDDLIVLNANGTYLYKDLGSFCSPSGNDNGTWNLNGNIIKSDGMIDGTIKSFDCKTLVVVTPDALVPGDQLVFTMTRQ
jgi:hypothetical protein